MRIRSTFNLLVPALIVSAAPAFADHSGITTTGMRLFDETLALNNTVTRSSLAYPVKLAVYRFADDAFALGNCITTAGVSSDDETGALDDHGSGDDHSGLPAVCRSRYERARANWWPVEIFLRDTRSDYPQVYSLYLTVREILGSLE